MSEHIVIKEEMVTETPEILAVSNQEVQPDTTSSSNVELLLQNDPSLLSALLQDDEEDEDDEIIREIDVYISPQLSNMMHLIQFPLQPASHCHQSDPNNNSTSSSTSSQKLKKQHTIKPPPPPQPIAARIKPQHAMLELDYKIPSASFSNQRQIPAPLHLQQRTFTSNTIPMVTHMAMGLFDNTNSKIDLVPLHRIMQMRPNFNHVDALYQNSSDNDNEEMDKQNKEDDEKTLQPIVFKKSESERAAIQRKSSYAFKRANEDAEEWIDLEVHGFGSLARKEALKKAYCNNEDRTRTLEFLKSGKGSTSARDGNVGYVRSLNYLPSAVIDEAVEDFTIDDSASASGVGGDDAINLEEQGEPEWKRELTSMVAALLQERGGMPIPYPVVRSRFQPCVPDDKLIDALSASAVLVRGNFVLKSSLMALSSVHIENVRDVILILMTKYGFVQRVKLYKAFQHANNDMSIIVTMDVINSLLELMGRKTTNGFEMKIDDDLNFVSQFNEVAKKHSLYWDLKEMQLEKYIRLYEEEEDKIDTKELNHVLFGTKVY